MRLDGTENTLEHFAEETGCPRPIPGNKVQLLDDAHRFYDAMLEDIRAAEHYILMEYFILRDDNISTTVLDALAERARNGVRVCVIVDFMGCFQHVEERGRFRRLKPDYLKPYLESGVKLVFYKPRLSFPRDHRKLTLIDGKVVYTGGRNISDLYLNGIPGIGIFWDMNLRIEGPAVDAFHAGFVRMWEACNDSPPGISFPGPPAPCGDTPLSILETPLPGRRPDPEEIFCRLFAEAKESIRLISPYFWPPRSIWNGLRDATRRGVDARILTGASSDMPSLIDKVLLHVVRKQAKKGYFTLHIQPGGFHHEKVVSIDGHLIAVGSYNLELLSLKVNHEMGVLIDDPAVARDFDRYFDEHARNERK